MLAGTAAGLLVAWDGSKYAGRGASLIGASLLAAALARLILPERYVGPAGDPPKSFLRV